MGSPKLPLTLVLHNLRSLHNVGAIFRSADAVGVEQLVLAGVTPTPPRAEISKTALGTTESVTWHQALDLVRFISEKRAAGYAIYALELTESAQDLYTSTLQFPAVLIAGHERVGVEPEILALCDQHLFLPMNGQAHSLNVATACGIALYELRRQLCYT